MQPTIVDSFIRVSQKFLEVLSEENSLLDQQNLKEVSDLVQQKQKVANQYTLLAEELTHAFPTLEIEANKKEELSTIAQELSQKLADNERMLSITLNSNKKILDTILRSVKKNGAPNCYYTKAGFFRRNQSTISMMSLDTKL